MPLRKPINDRGLSTPDNPACKYIFFFRQVQDKLICNKKKYKKTQKKVKKDL
jgi:hypothetical protein